MDQTPINLLEIKDLKKTFSLSGGLFSRRLTLTALENINFTIRQGETLGIVGESGCGKSTLGRCILQLLSPDEGQVLWLGQDLTRLPAEEMRRRRADLQIIFQDPLASLNPRMTVGEIIADPLRTLRPELNKEERRARVLKIMEAVGLLPEMINRYPHEFSGGQAQRIGIARALITEPKDEFGLTLIFISHNLSVVRHVSDRILVLYLGRIVELATGDEIYEQPKHPYTRALLTAVPIPDPKLARQRNIDALKGEIPSPINPPSGCTFRTRCRFAKSFGAETRPPLEMIEDGRLVACHRWREIEVPDEAVLGD